MNFLPPARNCVRHASVWLAATLAAIAVPAAAKAQTYTWNQPASGNSWQTAANWLPGGGPPNANSAVAIFGNVATGANSVTLSAGVTVGELRFEDVNAGTATAAYTIGAAAQTITFNNGGNPGLISVTGFTSTNQTIATGISAANAQPLTILNNGANGVNTLTLSGALSSTTSGAALNVGGASDTTISGAIGNTFGTLTKSGAGTLTLTAANSNTGGTVINGGIISISDQNQLSTGAVTLNGGALRVTADIFVNQNFSLGINGGTILTTAGTGASNPTFQGVISSGPTSGALTIDGGLFVDFNNNNTYTKPTIINNAGVRLTGGSGRFSGTSSVTINGYVGGQVGILTFDNSGSAADRVNNSAGITLNGGLLAGIAGLVSSSNEVVGNLHVKGFGSIFGTQFNGGFGSITTTFASQSRADSFSTLYLGGPIYVGSSVAVKFTSGAPPLSGNGTGTEIGIVPWIGGDRGAVDGSGFAVGATGFAETLFTYNASQGLIALDTNGANFAQVAAGDPFTPDSNNAIVGNPEALSGPVSILSLVLNTTGTGISTINGSGSLTVTTGAIANARGLRFNGPALNFDNNTGYLHLGSDITIQGASQITGSGGVVVSSNSTNGRNTLILTNTTNPNTFTGGLYLNGTARVLFNTSDTQLGGAGELISFRGGTLRFNGSSSVSLTTGGISRPLQLYAAGGGMIAVENSAGILTVPGIVSGTEQLTVTGPGTLVLSNTANTFAGGLNVGNSTVGVAGPGSLGSGPVSLGVTIGTATFSGGTLRFDASGTYSSSINHALSSTLNTVGNNVTLSGVVFGTGSELTKAGSGTLTLASANTYSGSTKINAGTVLVTNTSGSGTGYGAVSVESGGALGGSGTVAGPVTVKNGGKLIAGMPTSAGALTIRSSSTMASGSTFEVRLTGNTSVTQYGQLVLTSGASINLGSSTFQPTLGYTPNPTDKLFLINNQNATGGLTGTFNGLANGATYTFGDGTTAQISYFGDYGAGTITGGNDLVLHSFVPVPEPGTVLGIAGLALGGLAWRGRRRTATAN